MKIFLINDKNEVTNLIEADEDYISSLNPTAWANASEYPGVNIGDALAEPEPLEPPPTDYVTFADLAEMLGLAAEPDSRKAIAETLSDVALVSRERKIELELEPGIIDKPIKGLSM